MLILVGALTLAVALGLLTFVLIRPENTVVVPPASAGQPTESQVAPTVEVPPPSTPVPSVTPSEPEPEPSDEDNPTYTKNQSNTWRVWARSTSGSWDWFPETAVKQGASDQPINGIELCHP